MCIMREGRVEAHGWKDCPGASPEQVQQMQDKVQ